MDETIILVDTKNHPIGTALKRDVHTGNTPLHRGFSLFLFNNKKEVMLQQRSKKKKTWPEMWSNSVCGHPLPHESLPNAAKRRLVDELSLRAHDIQVIIPNYQYRFEKDGVVENEICPILIGITTHKPILNYDEVAAVTWMPWEKWLQEIEIHPQKYSPWSIEESSLLQASKKFQQFFQTL